MHWTQHLRKIESKNSQQKRNVDWHHALNIGVFGFMSKWISWKFPYILTVKMQFQFNKIQIHDPVSYPVCSNCNRDLNSLCVSEKLSIQNTVMSSILQFLFSRNKPLYFWPSVTVPGYVVPLCIWYATFRNNLVVSYPKIKILRNISVVGKFISKSR